MASLFSARPGPLVPVSDDRTVLLYHISAMRRGKTIESDQVMLARINEGLVTEVWTLPLQPRALRDFYAEAAEHTPALP